MLCAAAREHQPGVPCSTTLDRLAESLLLTGKPDGRLLIRAEIARRQAEGGLRADLPLEELEQSAWAQIQQLRLPGTSAEVAWPRALEGLCRSSAAGWRGTTLAFGGVVVRAVRRRGY
ncbi:MAG: hypothetical protein AB1758_12360 [Candidatus Eremiobacterota bacterium]